MGEKIIEPSSKTPLVEAVHLSKAFVSQSGEVLRILDDATFTIAKGETIAITGPSGSGKSTLLNLLGALDQPDSGTLKVAECEPAKLDAAEVAAYRNEVVGFVFQLHHLLPQCTVLENVLLPTLATDRSDPGADVQRAEELLQSVGLENRMMHRPGQLSGGERQRAAVARALINEPALLLADEPTGALDRENATRLVDLLLHLNQERGISIVMVTHATTLASRMSRVLELAEGRLIQR